MPALFHRLFAGLRAQAPTVARRGPAQSRHALLTVLDALPVAVALCAPHDTQAVPNRAMASLLQINGVGAVGAESLGFGQAFDWLQVLAPDDGPAWLAARDAAVRSGRPQALRCTLQLSGTACSALMQITPFSGGMGDTAAAGGAGDKTTELAVSLTLAQGESGLAQESVLQLRELLAVAEAEKWHFGQAVHDELGQRLSGMAYFAKALQRKLQNAQRAESEDAGWLTDLANESMSVARGLARGLLPVGSDDPAALGAALAELCERAAKSFGIVCTLSADPAFDAGGAAQASHLYHAIQELVTNAVKHGQPRQVQVTLDVLDGQQSVSVRNDGQGLVGDALPRFGMGLHGVRSRVAYLGAQFTLANDGPGAVLAVITLPLPAKAATHGAGL